MDVYCIYNIALAAAYDDDVAAVGKESAAAKYALGKSRSAL
jgi:hypothetical protein